MKNGNEPVQVILDIDDHLGRELLQGALAAQPGVQLFAAPESGNSPFYWSRVENRRQLGDRPVILTSVKLRNRPGKPHTGRKRCLDWLANVPGSLVIAIDWSSEVAWTYQYQVCASVRQSNLSQLVELISEHDTP